MLFRIVEAKKLKIKTVLKMTYSCKFNKGILQRGFCSFVPNHFAFCDFTALTKYHLQIFVCCDWIQFANKKHIVRWLFITKSSLIKVTIKNDIHIMNIANHLQNLCIRFQITVFNFTLNLLNRFALVFIYILIQSNFVRNLNYLLNFYI